MTPKIAPSLRAERIPVEQSPLVDFTPFRTGDPDQRKRAALELASAFRNVGFAYLAGHGVDHEQPLGCINNGVDLLDLSHQALIDVQATGGVDDQHIEHTPLRLLERSARNVCRRL